MYLQLRSITLLFVALVISHLSVGQEKTTIGILPFTFVEAAAKQDYVNAIQESVTNAFVKTKRFNIVDRTKMDELKKEKNLQKTEDFIDGSVVAQSASLGANYLVTGHVISASAYYTTTSSGIASYSAKLSINLKVIDVATSQVITSETIEPRSGSGLGAMMGLNASSPQSAIEGAIKRIEGKVDEFVTKNFQASFTIAEIQAKDDKGGAKTVLLAGGSAFGIEKGDRFLVYEFSEMEVNGKKLERKKLIGELKVSKVEDENFSVCSVRDGELAIAEKFNAKVKIKALTKKD